MTSDRHVNFQVHLPDAGMEATTWSIAGMDHFVNQPERENYGITSNKQMTFKKELSRHLLECDAWWQAIHK